MQAKRKPAKRKPGKKLPENRKITVTVPEETYFNIKQFAKQDIRTLSQQARLFIEIGLQVALQQDEEGSDDAPLERESAIGFHVERSDDED
ncbi:MAG: hypothetical protein UX75_C0036G0016 [Candidatus Moranbacteria bacterium GW2011_GWE2_47_10]|nr:MAG: hypothetical protein UX75_C0036G0016 [Candidatus Moranbacteria bacterium GW2011_GWE2_47_10]